MKMSNEENEPVIQMAPAEPGPEAAEPLVPVDSGHVTPEQLAELKQLAGKASEHYDRLLRTLPTSTISRSGLPGRNRRRSATQTRA